jgi:hypothetical protein
MMGSHQGYHGGSPWTLDAPPGRRIARVRQLPPPDHSALKATMGSTRAALRAGR